MRNYFTLDGVDSRDFGVYISGQGTFSAPGRDYNIIPVPGRNGDLVGPEQRFTNGTLKYPAFIYANFKQNISDFRNFLLSLFGYHDLIDSYHPDEIRKVFFEGSFEPTVTTKNDAGSFDITFNCKPQRYLASGQEVITFEAGARETETYSGEVATFDNLGDDEITALSVAVEPQQDLHGYDSPWPPGGGKNKFDISQIGSGSSGGLDYSVSGNTLSYSGEAIRSGWEAAYSFTLPVGTYHFHLETNETGRWLKGFTDIGKDVTVVVNDDTEIYRLALGATTAGVTYSGTITNIQIEEGSSFTGYAPYSNICPISGRTSATVTRTGKNLVNKADGKTTNRNWWIGADTVNAEPDGTFVLDAGTYTFSISEAQSGIYVRKNGSNVKSVYNKTQLTFSLAERTPIRLMLYKANVTVDYWNTLDIQLELGSTATAYEPYQGNTYTIQLGQTVYGGTLDVLTGVLTIDRAFVANNSKATKYETADGYYWYAGANELATPSISGLNAKLISDRLTPIGNVSAGSPEGIISWYANNIIRWKEQGELSQADYRTYLASNPLQLCYELATPFEISLTPTQITTLVGQNNVWADAGDVAVEVFTPEKPAVTNPTLFPSQPLLRVYGAGSLGVGSQTITITQADEYTDIDCEMMDAYKGTANKNPYVQLTDHNFPVFKPGVNNISLGTGITKVEITPRWWIV